MLGNSTRREGLVDDVRDDSQKLFKLRKLEALFELTSVITKQFSSDSTVSVLKFFESFCLLPGSQLHGACIPSAFQVV